MKTSTCRLCLREAELKNSHILSEFLYRPFYDEMHRAIEVDLSKPANRLVQKGIREHLLCGACETHLSGFEGAFKEEWYTKGKQPRPVPGLQWVTDLPYREFKLCLLSYLWRAGVSSHKVFSQVKLGPHEGRLRERVLAGDPGVELDYPVFCTPLVNRDDGSAVEAVVSPIPVRSKHGHHSYEFVFGGCSWLFVVSGHSLRSLFNHEKLYLSHEGRLPVLVKYLDEHKAALQFSRDLKTRGR